MTIRKLLLLLSCCLLMAIAVNADTDKRTTIVYEDIATEVKTYKPESKDLWLTTSDLTRVTKFTLKPQGMCRDELCIPIPEARKAEFISAQGTDTLFNLTAFARLVKQPFAYNEKHSVWFFGLRPEEQNSYVSSLQAPNFTLPDINGKQHSLSDFRGKKVLLITWASW